jgi:hypothetical protein
MIKKWWRRFVAWWRPPPGTAHLGLRWRIAWYTASACLPLGVLGAIGAWVWVLTH